MGFLECSMEIVCHEAINIDHLNMVVISVIHQMISERRRTRAL